MHTFTAGFLFCGLGAGARGFLQAKASVNGTEGRFSNLGGIDNDMDACRDFEMLSGGPALCADLSRLSPGQLALAWGPKAPDAVFLSPPCKGFSGLLSAASAKAQKYQELNELVLKGLFLVCETWKRPPAIIVLENVPRIVSRGAELLARARQLLASYGYLFHEGFHDCGEIGGLAQHRRRFLLIARDPKQVPSFVYQPPKKRVRGCGEVIGPLPLPNDPAAGRLHQLPRLSWVNWVRLALIPAGGDWRDLPKAGDVALAQTAAGADSFKGRPGLMGVNDWDRPVQTVTGKMQAAGGSVPASLSDPRLRSPLKAGQQKRAVFERHGVQKWDEPVGVIAGSGSNGTTAVADPRVPGPGKGFPNKYKVRGFNEPVGTITGDTDVQTGAQAVTDPRVPLTCAFRERSHAYGVGRWTDPAYTVTGSAQIDNGEVAVADPRIPTGYLVLTVEEALRRADTEKQPPKGVVPVIVSPHDGCWHRPLTTLELAALQGLPTMLDGKPLALAGTRDSTWREHIGNAVPVGAGEAIGTAILRALTGAAAGTWLLGSTDIWVSPEREEGVAA